MKVNCAVIGCTNSSYKLALWKKTPCFIHEGTTQSECGCEPPFRMFCFPSEKRNGEKRDHWVRLLRREGRKKGIAWEVGTADRVCSDHFVDKIPTSAYPDPSLNMGYDQPDIKKPRRTLFKYSKPSLPCSSKEQHEPLNLSIEIPEINNAMNTELLSPTFSEHSYCSVPSSTTTIRCSTCEDKTLLIKSYVKKVNRLTKQCKKLKIKQNKNTKQKFSWQLVNTDEKMNFYTGISSIAIFNVIFLLLKPYLPSIRYWRGPKHARSKVRQRKSTCQGKKLSQREELLLTIMRLRLGLMNEDVADRFGISKSLCSNTFTTFVKIIANVLGRALVVWLPREAIRDNLPESFIKSKHTKCRVILDCTEVFIERAKSLHNQAVTWSDYKHHNTVKVLIGIAPNGYITFLSKCYGGRASDKFITSDSGFYDLLERDDEVMADRGFQIKEELLLRYCSLSVPPGARVKSQMTASECKLTSNVANLRIHVERAINRIKTYRILKNVLPISMLHHMDDIVLSCAALCNLKPVLIRKSS